MLYHNEIQLKILMCGSIQKLQQDFLELRIRMSVRLLKTGEHIGNFWHESLDELCEQLPADSLNMDCGYTDLDKAKADAEKYLKDYIMEDNTL